MAVKRNAFPPPLISPSLTGCFFTAMPSSNALALTTILSNKSTIRFREGTDEADFHGLDLSKNPQKVGNGPFVWLFEDGTEASVTVIGKVVYSAIGDKTGCYFSLPDSRYVRNFICFPFTL